ncbi:ATP-binding protein [Nonomuraea glycinis]|uniref:ATP-binding protein n=1 Tax=Nonomuraea glycinis TaxID=2047744 RepID=UPI002E1682D1|nr:ATP-binding protein [Nonomuraea glycinis]
MLGHRHGDQGNVADLAARVADAGSSTTTPAVRASALADDGGRGLWLVDTLADEWGFQHDKTGGLAWFRLTEHD